MKRKFILVAAICSLIPSATLANNLLGTVNFSGSLISAPCKILPASRSIEIDFGDVVVDSPDMDIIKRDFITLQNCKFQKKAGFETQRIDVKMLGTPDLIKPELLKVSGNARGIAIRMFDSVIQNLNVADRIEFVLPIDVDENRNILLPFNAKIERNGGALVHGNFFAVATYQIEYK